MGAVFMPEPIIFAIPKGRILDEALPLLARVGIEPAADGGLLEVSVERRGEELIIVITNPTAGQSQHAAGNHMALANIRERLALYYDLEARLDILAGADRYEVRITLPCQVLRP